MSGFSSKWKKVTFFTLHSIPSVAMKRAHFTKPTSHINFCGIVYYLCQLWAQQLLAFKCDIMMKYRHPNLPKLCSATLSRGKYCKSSKRDIVHPTYWQPPARTWTASSLDFWHSCFQCFQSTLAHPHQCLHL